MHIICIGGTSEQRSYISERYWKDSDYWAAPKGMRRYAPLFFKLLDLI